MGESPKKGHPTLLLFGQRIRAQRKALGLSLETFAKRCDLHWSYIGQVERGKRNVCIMNVTVIAQALEIDAGDLLKGCKP